MCVYACWILTVSKEWVIYYIYRTESEALCKYVELRQNARNWVILSLDHHSLELWAKVCVFF